MQRWIAALLLILAALPAQAHEPMTPQRMAEIVRALDSEAQSEGALMSLTVADVPILIIFDVQSDRMRAVTPIRQAEELSPEDLERVMQANFDTALDARYAVAKGRLWAVFLHPLSPLDDETLISGIGQVANLVLSYGTTFSSGATAFGGGDSGDLIRDLLEKGQRI